MLSPDHVLVISSKCIHLHPPYTTDEGIHNITHVT
jgi:hypothetical protein